MKKVFTIDHKKVLILYDLSESKIMKALKKTDLDSTMTKSVNILAIGRNEYTCLIKLIKWQ